MAETDKPADTTGVAVQAQPGTVIVPSGAPRQADQRTAVLAEPPSAALAATPPAEALLQPTAHSPASTAPPQAHPKSPHTATPRPSVAHRPALAAPLPANDFSIDNNGTVSWTAGEFVAHDKSANWYTSLLLAAALLAGLVFLLTRDIISTSVILVGAFLLAFYGGRKPKQLAYQASSSGVNIGRRHHSYEEFRSFAVEPEGQLSSIIFVPLKRFAPLTTIYCDPEHEDQIIGLFVDILPFEEHTYDAVDRLMQRIRF